MRQLRVVPFTVQKVGGRGFLLVEAAVFVEDGVGGFAAAVAQAGQPIQRATSTEALQRWKRAN